MSRTYARIDVSQGILAGAWQVDGHRRDTHPVQCAARGRTIFLPPVDAPPLQHDGRLGDVLRNLQIADQLLILERNRDDLERRIEILGGLEIDPQRMSVCRLLAGRAGHRIARDTKVIEGEQVGFLGAMRIAARGRKFVALRFIFVAELAPQLRPMVTV